MKRIYFVIGEGGVGKSTLVRCLTGIRQAGRPNIRLASGIDISLWTYMRSMQEPIPPMNPAQLLADITDPSEAAFEYYLIPLRITGINGCPDAQDYIDFLNPHCITMGAVVLSRDAIVPTLRFAIPQLSIPLSHTIPANGNANTVRTAFGWM